MTKKSTPNRRQFLAAATTSGVALLAGCSSGASNSAGNTSNSSNSDGSGGTPTPKITTVSESTRFVNATLTGPSQVTVGDSFRLTLRVTNIGSETGTLSETIRVTEGSRRYEVSISQTIESGERIEIQTEPIQLDVADTYTFSVGITEVSHVVSVRAKTGTVGTAFNLGKYLKATVKDIEFRPIIRYSPRASEQTRVLNPPAKESLAILRVGLENIGTVSASVASDAFQLAGGSVYSALGTGATPLSAADIEGKPLVDLELSPAEQRTGWVLAHIPRSKVQKDVTALYQRDGAGTPPEIKWIAKSKEGTYALPEFSVKNFQLPNSTSLGQDANATVAISNEGAKARTFRGMVQYRTGNSSNWRTLHPITAKIQAGKTIQQNFTVNSSSSGPVTYRIAPLGVTETINYTPPVLSFGETYESNTNVNITVDAPKAVKSVVIKNPGVPKYRVKPSSGERFVLVWVEATVVGDSEAAPWAEEFTIQTKSGTFTRDKDVNFPIVSPVEGGIYNNARYDPDIGTVLTGYLVFSVPKQIPLNKMTVQWLSHLGETVRWTKGGKGRSN